MDRISEFKNGMLQKEYQLFFLLNFPWMNNAFHMRVPKLNVQYCNRCNRDRSNDTSVSSNTRKRQPILCSNIFSQFQASHIHLRNLRSEHIFLFNISCWASPTTVKKAWICADVCIILIFLYACLNYKPYARRETVS